VTVLGAVGPWSPRRLGSWCRWRFPERRAGDCLALTFDDGPDAAVTPKVLDLLDRLGLRASFFVLGEAVAAAPGLLAEVCSAGHLVGVHGWAHRHHLVRSPGWVVEDLNRAVQTVGEITGQAPAWFRPPYGQLSAGSLRAARQLGLQTVLWSTWGREFADSDLERVRRRLVAGLRPGAVVLLHDSDRVAPPGTGARTVAVLPRLADALAERGLRAEALDRVAA